VSCRTTWLVLVAALGGSAPNPDSLQAWTASGRLAMAANGEGGSGSFTWDQQLDATTLSVRGPLGAGAFQVNSAGDGFRITDSSGHELDPEQARDVLRARLGGELPWSELRYWMLGVPSPAEPAQVAESDHAPLRTIEQAGWTVGYDAFEMNAGLALPRRFTVQQGGVRLKVIVDDWRLAAGGSGP
jgi:outer membrane lipoprotein LolB